MIETPRFPYSRPEFLYLTSEDEVAVSGDQTTRPVLVPKDPYRMPLYAGYAETINAGKTQQNEDQCCAKLLHLVQPSSGYGPDDYRNRESLTVGPRRKRADSDCRGAETERMPDVGDAGRSFFRRRHSDDDLLTELKTGSQDVINNQ